MEYCRNKQAKILKKNYVNIIKQSIRLHMTQFCYKFGDHETMTYFQNSGGLLYHFNILNMKTQIK